VYLPKKSKYLTCHVIYEKNTDRKFAPFFVTFLKYTLQSVYSSEPIGFTFLMISFIGVVSIYCCFYVGCSVLLTEEYVMVSYSDRGKLDFINFTKKRSADRKFEKLSSLEPKVTQMISINLCMLVSDIG
jgi:hypothetical protein